MISEPLPRYTVRTGLYCQSVHSNVRLRTLSLILDMGQRRRVGPNLLFAFSPAAQPSSYNLWLPDPLPIKNSQLQLILVT
jgi:hypothetical protein